jgi:hypothetical protein
MTTSVDYEVPNVHAWVCTESLKCWLGFVWCPCWSHTLVCYEYKQCSATWLAAVCVRSSKITKDAIYGKKSLLTKERLYIDQICAKAGYVCVTGKVPSTASTKAVMLNEASYTEQMLDITHSNIGGHVERSYSPYWTNVRQTASKSIDKTCPHTWQI